MKRVYWAHIDEFLATDDSKIVGDLVTAAADSGIQSQRSTQIIAWTEELQILKAQLQEPLFQSWTIILEYNIPRRSKRPDVVLLAKDLIFVVEFKLGARSHDASARWQVEEYCFSLRDFHAASADRKIIPVLCASDAPSRPFNFEKLEQSAIVPETTFATRHDLGELLMKIYRELHREDVRSIDPATWLESPYRPTPSIIEAAVRLYEGHGVREISHSYAENLGKTTQMLVEVIKQARQNRHRSVCFVTGVPGAGKTLTGLDVVHDPDLRAGSSAAGVFLSGNGPLVKIVREALVLSRTASAGKRRDREHEVSTFIQNVHMFLSYYKSRPQEWPEHVVVFDEAQRAWSAQQMRRKQRGDSSEASALFDVMERLPDWGVVIALVGGGQEIYLGEAGLEEWGRALNARTAPWRVVASPEVLKGGISVAGHRLFDGAPREGLDLHAEDSAHLGVGVRSHRAQQFAGWANDLLDFDLQACRQNLPIHREFPVVVTRDLQEARAWLRARSTIDRLDRCGLVATSEDQRLRAYGLERSSGFRLGYSFGHWFLAPPDDKRSSFSLEVAASEFECQGLELDWVGLCWGGDLSPQADDKAWECRRFRGSQWQAVRQEIEQAYIRNRYRVLLTRARKGMVIWVPWGDPDDPSRDPMRFEGIYRALRRAGVPDIERDFLKELAARAA